MNLLHYLAIIPGSIFIMFFIANIIKYYGEDIAEIIFEIFWILLAAGFWLLFGWGLKGIFGL